jgi:hypothetical protein
MSQLYKLFFPALMLCLVIAVTATAQSVKKLTVNVETRQTAKGYATTLKGTLFYTASGDLVSHITFPREYIMLANNLGEIRIYDPATNTVKLLQNLLFSTSSMQLHYFLDGLTGDLGLKQAGYDIENTRFDNDLSITTWKNRYGTPKNPIQKATLVKRKDTLIYLDYKDQQGAVIRKMFFYNYTNLNNILFPRTITEVLYEGKDSTVTRTEYTGFRLNDEATGKYFNYKIPLNAKLSQ